MFRQFHSSNVSPEIQAYLTVSETGVVNGCVSQNLSVKRKLRRLSGQGTSVVGWELAGIQTSPGVSCGRRNGFCLRVVLAGQRAGSRSSAKGYVPVPSQTQCESIEKPRQYPARTMILSNFSLHSSNRGIVSHGST